MKTYAPGKDPESMRKAQIGRTLGVWAYAARWFFATRPPTFPEVSRCPAKSRKNIKR